MNRFDFDTFVFDTSVSDALLARLRAGEAKGEPVETIAAITSAAPPTLPFTKGTPGNDTIIGTDTGERIYAGGARDIVKAKGGNDRVFGEAGNDDIDLGRGNDYGNGGPGDDTIRLIADGRDKVNLETDLLIVKGDHDGSDANDRIVAAMTFDGAGHRSAHLLIENESKLRVTQVTDDRVFATDGDTRYLIYWDGGETPTRQDIGNWFIGWDG